MPKGRHFDFDVIVIGGGHAGTEAAWAAANCGGHVALVTMDPARIGTMSCNPAIGGLAKGQMVREIDALGGLMGLAADRTGIQFRILNASKGPAVQGPRCQSDKYRYAQEVRRLIATRPNIQVMAATVEDFIVENGRCTGVIVKPSSKSKPWRHNSEKISDGTQCDPSSLGPSGAPSFFAPSTVLTTGTFMRGLLHTGDIVF